MNPSCPVHLLGAFFLPFPNKVVDIYDFHLRDITCTLSGALSVHVGEVPYHTKCSAALNDEAGIFSRAC
jgi:hypothetical protein